MTGVVVEEVEAGEATEALEVEVEAVAVGGGSDGGARHPGALHSLTWCPEAVATKIADRVLAGGGTVVPCKTPKVASLGGPVECLRVLVVGLLESASVRSFESTSHRLSRHGEVACSHEALEPWCHVGVHPSSYVSLSSHRGGLVPLLCVEWSWRRVGGPSLTSVGAVRRIHSLGCLILVGSME